MHKKLPFLTRYYGLILGMLALLGTLWGSHMGLEDVWRAQTRASLAFISGVLLVSMGFLTILSHIFWQKYSKFFYIALFSLSFLAYFQYGGLNLLQPRAQTFHVWDTYHYVLGARYSEALGYTGLYDCTVAADRANGAIFPPKALTKWRDLRTNQITFATQAALSRAQNCALRLQKMGQWTDFRRDVAFFKARETRWASLVRDHGFNATPFWLAVYAPLLSDSSQVLTDDLLQKWAMIDVSFFVGSIIALYLAFGLKNTAWSLCLLAVWSPIFYFWTGGSIGRWDWFFYLALLLFCLKKEYFYLAGLCIALSILLRIFPVFHLFFLIILILCQKPKIGIKILASGLFFGFLGLIFIVFSSNFVKSIKAPS